MPVAGCGSRPGRWSTACGRASRPLTSRPGSPRCLRPVRDQGRPGGARVARRGLDPGPVHATGTAGLAAIFAARAAGCPAAGRPAARPGRGGAARPPGRHRRQGGHPGWAARRPGRPRPPDRRLEAGWRRCWPHTEGAKLTQIRGVGTVVAAGLVAFVGRTGRWASGPRCGGRPGWTRPAASPGQRPQLRDQPRGLGLGPAGVLDLAAGVCRQPAAGATATARASSTEAPQGGAGRGRQPVGRTCFALMASGADYDPGHQAKRLPQRHGEHRRRVVRRPNPGTLVASGGPIRRRSRL